MANDKQQSGSQRNPGTSQGDKRSAEHGQGAGSMSNKQGSQQQDAGSKGNKKSDEQNYDKQGSLQDSQGNHQGSKQQPNQQSNQSFQQGNQQRELNSPAPGKRSIEDEEEVEEGWETSKKGSTGSSSDKRSSEQADGSSRDQQSAESDRKQGGQKGKSTDMPSWQRQSERRPEQQGL